VVAAASALVERGLQVPHAAFEMAIAPKSRLGASSAAILRASPERPAAAVADQRPAPVFQAIQFGF